MKRLFSAMVFVVLTFLYFTGNHNVQAQTPAKSNIEVGNEVGQDIGDFEGKGPKDEVFKLSQLRGKMVLLVLWNSLCGHCVTENVKFKQTYADFHDKKFKRGDGFDVYCIGLDKERATWIEALEKQQYPWKSNVYVLDSWKDPEVRFFGVKNLPGTFLIDENGIILAKGITAEELNAELTKYLEK